MALADYAKKDVSFIPVKDAGTERWHTTVRGREFELLLTGTKFFDTRAENATVLEVRKTQPAP